MSVLWLGGDSRGATGTNLSPIDPVRATGFQLLTAHSQRSARIVDSNPKAGSEQSRESTLINQKDSRSLTTAASKAEASAASGLRVNAARSRVLGVRHGLESLAAPVKESHADPLAPQSGPGTAAPGAFPPRTGAGVPSFDGNASADGNGLILGPPRARVEKQAEGQGSTPDPATPKPRPVQWRLEFDDGLSLAVTGIGLIGRNPAPAAGEAIEHFVTIADDTLSVSRTHLEFGMDEAGLWVRDRGSTNGSQLVEVNGRRTLIEPGLRVPAPSGCTLHMGARRFEVRTMTGRAVIGTATINWGLATHGGAVRNNNQDAYCTEPPVFVVADGMGGRSAGDVASREAVVAMSALAGHEPVTMDMLRVCLADARARIGRISVEHGRPPGTTLSGVIVTQVEAVPSWMVVNIGDSRTYCLDADGFRQISVDHSLVQQLIDAGVLVPSAARSHPSRSVVTRALLAETEHWVDVWPVPMIVGDRILVCSDGLTSEVDDESIAAILRAISDPQLAANALVQAALEAGGHDNVTVLVVDAVAVDAPCEETLAMCGQQGMNRERSGAVWAG